MKRGPLSETELCSRVSNCPGEKLWLQRISRVACVLATAGKRSFSFEKIGEKTKKTVSTNGPHANCSEAITGAIVVIVLTVGILLGLWAWMNSDKGINHKPAHGE
jgi:hypothetical protein